MEDDLITKANLAAERLEAANKRMEELVRINEELEAKRILSGKSEAGSSMPQMTQEEKDRAEMKLYFKGTAIEQALK
jgi:hypothetical protein